MDPFNIAVLATFAAILLLIRYVAAWIDERRESNLTSEERARRHEQKGDWDHDPPF